MMGPGDGDDAASSSASKRRRRPEPTPVQRALALLTRREHSQLELTRKLRQRGIATQEAQAAVDRLAEAGWQNDARFAESLVRSRAASGYGAAYIRAELKTHGLSSSQVQDALAAFEGEWPAIAHALLERRHPQALFGEPAAQRKAADFLLRRGFSMEEMRAALNWDEGE